MAVYTTVDPPALAALLEAYPIGRPLRLEGILQGVENSNYSLETESGRYVLTLFERRAPEADLPYFLSLMEHLAAAGFPAPQPIRRPAVPVAAAAGLDRLASHHAHQTFRQCLGGGHGAASPTNWPPESMWAGSRPPVETGRETGLQEPE